MKVILVIVTAGILTGCATYKPVQSKCFDHAGNAICTFTPLSKLHATGGELV